MGKRMIVDDSRMATKQIDADELMAKLRSHVAA